MKFFSFKKRVLLGAVLIALLLFFLRPGASPLKWRIAGSMRAGLGRPVEIGSVHVRLLPRPGFDLNNLVVYDDPAFGAEPMLRASEVTADLRLSSLLRGRLEISQLDLTEPSLNLVRDANGHWNLAALLERAAQSSLAPTAKSRSEARPGFPYIAATSARINFKVGQEKKPYALTNADFTLWQESENSWGVRLKAQPIRSDLNLSDTGTLSVDGTWQRATTLRETPLQFSLEWDRPQLGQLTRLLTGNDKGWRGTVLLDATLSGTPSQLQISTDASIRDFRRYDISAGNPLRLAAHCDAQYSSTDYSLHQVFCRGPVGNGAITLHGDVGLFSQHKYDVILMAEEVPANALVNLAARAKKNLPDDLTAAGELEGSVSLRADGSEKPAQFLGSGQLAQLQLSSGKDELNLGNIPFVFTSAELTPSARGQRNPPTTDSQAGPRLEFGPTPVPIGRAASLVAQGFVTKSGYNVTVSGDADVPRILRTARMVGIPALASNLQGDAQVELQISGSWVAPHPDVASDFAQPQITGKAKLHNVRVELRRTESPVEILSADVQLLASEVRVNRIIANASRTQWSGSMNMPRGCGMPAGCVVHFNLSTNQVLLDQVARWLNPQPTRPWYKLLPSTPAKSFFANVKASGSLAAREFQFHTLSASHVNANIDLDSGKLRVSHLTGDLLGGTYRGDVQADFSIKPASYFVSGAVNQISLERLSNFMKGSWATGLASGTFNVRAAGADASEFWKSAEGSVDFEMRNGSLPHFALGDLDPVKFNLLQGTAILYAGKLHFEQSVMTSPAGVFQLTGSASLSRELDLKLARSPMSAASLTASHGYTIGGTLDEPRITNLGNLQAEAHLNSSK